MPNNLDSMIQLLLQFESGDEFKDSKKVLDNRVQTREGIKESLREGVEIPANEAKCYAGLRRRKGNPKYKVVTEKLRDMLRIPPNDYEQIVEESRGEQLILEYGTIEDFMKKGRDSSDYVFITPQI